MSVGRVAGRDISRPLAGHGPPQSATCTVRWAECLPVSPLLSDPCMLVRMHSSTCRPRGAHTPVSSRLLQNGRLQLRLRALGASTLSAWHLRGRPSWLLLVPRRLQPGPSRCVTARVIPCYKVAATWVWAMHAADSSCTAPQVMPWPSSATLGLLPPCTQARLMEMLAEDFGCTVGGHAGRPDI